MSYAYKWIDPKTHPPFVAKIRRTRGEFGGWTAPTGPAHVHYAIFNNRSSQVLIPEYDLTPETKERLPKPSEGQIIG